MFLAEWMMSLDSVGVPVRIPNLGITGETWVADAIELISSMLCFKPATRLKMPDVCNKIQKIQGLYSMMSISIEILSIVLVINEKFSADTLLMATIYTNET